VRAAAGVWRWRHNPLRRTTDLVEAWVALATVLLIALAAPAAGWVSGTLVNDVLQQSVRVQHQQRHHIQAVVVRRLPDPPLSPGTEASAERGARLRVMANWTAPDGTPHTGSVTAGRQASEAGDRFRIWTDDRGRLVSRPMDGATATTHAALAGFASAAAAGTLAEVVRRLVVRRLMHRRYARLDRAWAAAGPDWGRTGAGS